MKAKAACERAADWYERIGRAGETRKAKARGLKTTALPF